jgi:hypothetical protein
VREFAKEINISNASISLYERVGKAAIPRPENLKVSGISVVYSVSAETRK